MAVRLEVRALTAAEMPLWDALFAESAQRSLFAERWWIDIVTDGHSVLLGCFTGSRLLAGLPIWPCATLGVRRLRQPPLTPYWGPLFGAIDGSYTTRLNTEMSILRAFADAVTAWADVTMAFHPTLNNWLPFHWTGYDQRTRYTYRIDRLADFPLTESAMQKPVRQKLRQATTAGVVMQDDVESAVVAALHERTMARQGLRGSAEILAVWPKLAEAARARGRLFTTCAYDPDGNAHTARALLWDDRYAYALFGGSDPRFRQSGAGTLSLWHELQRAVDLAPGYDFEGSTIEPIETFFRAFGGTLTPYLLVTRNASLRLNTARSLLGLAGRLRRAPQRKESAKEA
jgi:hypothetical protein